MVEKSIQKLKKLHTIKLLNASNEIDDISCCLGAENLFYLKITGGILKTNNLERLSHKIKSSRLEKLTFKNFSFQENGHIDISFLQLLIVISCSSLKGLKIYTKFTPNLLNLLIQRLNTFTNLEFIGVNLLENYASFEDSIKNLISIIKSKKTSLSKIKVHTYTWNIKKLQGSKNIEIVGYCLTPLDLLILVELCEKRVVINVDVVNLSDNKEIVDDNFLGIMVRIIKALGYPKVIIKRSRCEIKHKKEIKDLIGKKDFHLKFRIS